MLLEEYIRNVLEENNQINPKIEKMIQKIDKDLEFIRIYDKGNEVTILHEAIDKEKSLAMGGLKCTKPIGAVRCKASDNILPWVFKEEGLENDMTKNLGIGQGEKNSCWYVVWSKHPDSMGPLLYEIAIEYISSSKKSSLKPDAVNVTPAAKKVWEIYHSRSDIKNIQLDITKDLSDKMSAKEPITNDIRDDTVQISAIKDAGPENWDESPLSFSYKKENTHTIEALKKMNLIQMPSYKIKVKNFFNKIKRMLSRN